MKLCMNHWNHLKANTPEGTWLTGNLLVMTKAVEKLGKEVYNMQRDLGSDGCPVCFLGGDEFLETVIKEINNLNPKKEKK